ncbi:Hemerythrin domain protein [Candidatus Syntrophocurvum alkaliphilum]|uniref:Hemerythrin domain protein n=1 Tax=Candidatus Syntrophocurvum alkaliphilum TaxID=2293317 RepID=A0A6I6DG46_9FIRM|nr:bacteriohemerythrin [Candidatus Syntrophocurvum alkaliphilum]QGU00008.1 Hemerythrin domain protein [Candidatus Syntrophocurvum alkaliphilum]
MIKWKKEYELGINQIDEQHKKLFEIAGRAYAVLKDEFRIDKYDDIANILEELKNYTIYHFETEENLMKEIGYKKFLSHKVSHDDFIEKINNIDLEAVDDAQDQYLLEVLDFIIDWIDKHILGADKLITQTRD